MKFPFCKCPFCECDSLLESKIFWNAKDALPKTRYLQAYVKYSKIKKLAEVKEYKERLGNSGRIRDLIKDCLNDMNMSLELKYGKRYVTKWSRRPQSNNSHWKKNWRKQKIHSPLWNSSWMDDLAELRNHAIHKMTAVAIKLISEVGGEVSTFYHLRAESPNGKITETNEEILPYLEKTLQKIKAKLGITEI
ncbi:MAG: hypothetical protein WAN82_02625 [Candidatus Bathyarchaeia archaeon]